MAFNDSSQSLLLTSNLGSVGSYDPTIPLARYIAKGSLRAGQVFLRMTLDEMIQIRRLSKKLNEDHYEHLRDTKARFDYLMEVKADLESLKKRNWLVKIWQHKDTQRAKRAFNANTLQLLESAKSKSDHLKRDILSTRTTELAPTQSEFVEQEEQIQGVSVDLDGPVNQEALAIIRDVVSFLTSLNSFTNATPSESPNGGTSSAFETETLSSTRSSGSTLPSSPGSASSFNSLNVQVNCINTKDTNCTGLTIINGGSGNNGSCIIDPGIDIHVNSTSS